MLIWLCSVTPRVVRLGESSGRTLNSLNSNGPKPPNTWRFLQTYKSAFHCELHSVLAAQSVIRKWLIHLLIHSLLATSLVDIHILVSQHILQHHLLFNTISEVRQLTAREAARSGDAQLPEHLYAVPPRYSTERDLQKAASSLALQLEPHFALLESLVKDARAPNCAVLSETTEVSA